jgi:hypothetical protein
MVSSPCLAGSSAQCNDEPTTAPQRRQGSRDGRRIDRYDCDRAGPLLQGHRTRVGQLMAGQRDIYAVRTKKGAATHHHAAVEDAATCERERHDRT